MGQSFKKIIMISVIIIIIFGAIAIISPHINSLNGDTIQKKIILHQTSNNPEPFYIEDRGIRLKTTIAETDNEKEQGLSGTASLADDEGMLFIFNESGYYQMLMKDMLYPLDIIWLDKNFNINDIKKDVQINSYPETFTSSSPAQYVLEINSGLSDKYGFMVGDKFKAVDLRNDF